jgi:hypothetical protein
MWDSASLRKETIKTGKRSKVLNSKEVRLERIEKKRSKAKHQQGCCASPCKHPAHLTPTFSMSVFYCLSFLHLQLPTVKLGEQ